MIELTENCSYFEIEMCLLTKLEEKYKGKRDKGKKTIDKFQDNGIIKKTCQGRGNGHKDKKYNTN